jgi:MscS family membrane protein
MAPFKCIRWVPGSCVFLLGATIALGQEVNPLAPADRSSPRAAIRTLLDFGDTFGEFMAREYLPSPSRSRYEHLIVLAKNAGQGLDLSEVPPVARLKTGSAATIALYEVLSRIPLPPPDKIPDADQIKHAGGADAQRWVVPNTEITLVRVQSGRRSGEFLFSPDTVARAAEFYERVRAMPYARPVPLKNLYDIIGTNGGWMIPYGWIEAMPASIRAPIAGQPGWRWIGLALLLIVFGFFLSIAHRVSRLGSERRPFLRALARFAMPVSILLAMPAVAHLALVQLNFLGPVANSIRVTSEGIVYLTGAWMALRLASVVAEAIISSPHIGPESIDAHLIRVGARLMGAVAGATLIAIGADHVGVPVYGIVAGLGVGGLAIALAAQPTIENLIGGMNLFADRVVRVGDVCKSGDTFGTVEAIGIRSARIRGVDRTLTTIPNAALAKMPIVNLTQRDQFLIHTVIGLRYETTPEQLRYVLVKLRELLLGHSRVNPNPARARFVGFGASSLDIEVFAYVMTKDWGEFLGIREDILLRVMEIVEQSGSALAFPSQTLYLGRDRGTDETKTHAAEASVQEWRDNGSLPFPDFSPEQAGEIRGSLVFPPVGASGAPRTKP